MSHLHPAITPPDLVDHPELGVLVILEGALEIANLAIIAAHPELVDADPDSAPNDMEALAADHVLIAADALLRHIASYRTAITAKSYWAQRSHQESADVDF